MPYIKTNKYQKCERPKSYKDHLDTKPMRYKGIIENLLCFQGDLAAGKMLYISVETYDPIMCEYVGLL